MEEQAKKKPGPKKKYGPRGEVHLKFSPEVLAFIQAQPSESTQAYFDQLIARDREQAKEQQS